MSRYTRIFLLKHSLLCPILFLFIFFCFLGGVASAEYYSIWYHYRLESNTLYVFLPDGVSVPCDRGWILTSSSADDDVIIQLHQSNHTWSNEKCVCTNK